MRIAIIGYGSLIWDMDGLDRHTTGKWNIGGGPNMPVEFSRISPKRKQGLVLVVDDTLDHQCKTCVIESGRSNLDEAVADLAAREHSKPHMIASAQRGDEKYSDWLLQNKYDAMIWTALPGNFEKQTGQRFTHEKARDYLQTLAGSSLNEAWDYIENAPKVTNTPFRRFLKQDRFWQTLKAERG